MEAWRHPMLTDWVFSKRKVGGVTAIAGMAPRAHAPANVRIVLRDNEVLLEKQVGGTRRLYTVKGKRLEAEFK
jgi:hypothetical protein